MHSRKFNAESGAEQQDVHARVTKKIVEMLENGVRPWAQPWQGGKLGTRPLRHNGVPYAGRPQYETLLRQVMIGYGVKVPQNAPSAAGQAPASPSAAQWKVSELAEKFKRGSREPEQKPANPAPLPRDKEREWEP